MGKNTIKQLSLFDATTGELLMTKYLNEGSQNEGEWVIMYRTAIDKLVDEAPNFTVLKVFLKLAQMQEYDDKPVKTTKKAVADMLHTSYYHVHDAFKWLENENYIIETKARGQSQFDLNPNVTTCGKNRDKKLLRWNQLKKIKEPPKNAENIIDLGGIS